jgi:hypothetical protein
MHDEMNHRTACSTCRYWRKNTCRRYPPLIVQTVSGTAVWVSDDGPETHWPRTDADDWCGEYVTQNNGGHAETTAGRR